MLLLEHFSSLKLKPFQPVMSCRNPSFHFAQVLDLTLFLSSAAGVTAVGWHPFAGACVDSEWQEDIEYSF